MNQRSDLTKHLGKGWPLPIAPTDIFARTRAEMVDASAENNTQATARRIQYVEGVDKVRQAIWIILQTEPGERLMRPEFGCGLRQYLMKPNNSATHAMIQRDVERALVRWERRIRLQQVVVEPGEDPAVVLIAIQYVHLRDGSSENLVFPFYLE